MCRSYRAAKSGRAYFLKLYVGSAGSGYQPKEHHALQSRVFEALRKVEGVSESILEHGVTPPGELRSIMSSESAGYFQVKPWLDGVDLKCFLAEDNAKLRRWSTSGMERDREALLEALDWRLKLCQLLTGIVARVHERDVIHQDLKPEQFFLVTDKSLKLGFRPLLADFDWGFFSGERPLQVVGTDGWRSPEHVSGATPSRASDVFTLALIVFRVMSLNVNPLLSDEEAAEFADPDDCIRRCAVKRRLASLYEERIGTEGVDLASVRALDDVIRNSLARDPGRRGDAMALWRALQQAKVRMARESPAPSPLGGASEVRRWIRLVTKTEPSAGRYIVAAQPETWMLTRGVARAAYPMLADDEGDPFHRYFGRDPETPGLEFLHTPAGWDVRVPDGAQNGFVLVRTDGTETQLTSVFAQCDVGDELVLMSKRRGMRVIPCTLVISE